MVFRRNHSLLQQWRHGKSLTQSIATLLLSARESSLLQLVQRLKNQFVSGTKTVVQRKNQKLERAEVLVEEVTEEIALVDHQDKVFAEQVVRVMDERRVHSSHDEINRKEIRRHANKHSATNHIVMNLAAMMCTANKRIVIHHGLYRSSQCE
jgi:hypothetical protein